LKETSVSEEIELFLGPTFNIPNIHKPYDEKLPVEYPSVSIVST